MDIKSKTNKILLSSFAASCIMTSAFAGAPTGTSAVLNGAVNESNATVSVIVTDAVKFVSGSDEANSTELSSITYMGDKHPISAVTNDTNTSLLLTFNLSDIGTAKHLTAPLTINADILSDANDLNNSLINIIDGNITDNAKPLVMQTAFIGDKELAVTFSEEINTTTVTASDFTSLTKDGGTTLNINTSNSSNGFTNGFMFVENNTTVVLSLLEGLGNSALNDGNISIADINDTAGNTVIAVSNRTLIDKQEARTENFVVNSATNGKLVAGDTVGFNFSETLHSSSLANIQASVNTTFRASTDINATVTTIDNKSFLITFSDGSSNSVDINISGGKSLQFGENNITDLAGNTNQSVIGFNIQENTDPVAMQVKVAEFDVDKDAKYSSGDRILMQFESSINITDMNATSSGVLTEISSSNGKSFGTGATLNALDSSVDISEMQNFITPENNGTDATTFMITLGTDTNVSSGDNILIDSTNISGLDSNVSFSLLAVVDASDIGAEVEKIRTELANAKDIPEDMRDAIETILSEIDTLLLDVTNNESQIIEKLEMIYSMADKMDNDDAKMYGADASSITGTVTLPSNVTLTAQENCFDSNYQPLSTCNTVFIDLMSTNDEWLGSTMVKADGSYTLYYRALNTNEELNTTVQVHTQFEGIQEHFFRDFGDDNAIDGSGSAADTFKSHQEINWIEDTSTGMWKPEVNHLIVSSQETTLNLNIANTDGDKYVLEGTVKVPSDFTPGEIWGTNGEWLGMQMVNLTAINTRNGKHHWTEISRTETNSSNDTYPFKFKLPSDNNDRYIFKIEKMSDKNGVFEWTEMYLNDGGDNNFGTNPNADSLKSAANIMWNETSKDSGIWLPDTSVAGSFDVNSSISGIDIDITTFGNNFYKIAGSITPPSDFDLTNFNNNMNVDILDAKTGWWIGGSPVSCDTNGENCTYSVILGDSLNDYDGSSNGGYIVQVNQNHWDNNWENSWWKNFYFDLGSDNSVNGNETLKNQMEVRWEESDEKDSNGYNYWKPDVNHLHIASGTATNAMPDVNISFSSYVAPITYTISGTISGIPAGAKWANVHMYDPINYVGSGAEIKSDGTYTINNVKEGKYILELHYDVEDGGNFKHYQYIITDDDGDFSTGTTTAVDGMDIKWMPYASDGSAIPEASTYSSNFDWTSVSYWAPEETSSQKVMLNVTEDVDVVSLAITQPTFYNVAVALSGAGDTKNVNFNLFVPGEPIGRWENNTTTSGGATGALLKDLKNRDDYQLQLWIDGLGEFWLDGSDNSLKSDVTWVGLQDGSICENWKTNTSTCNWDNPVEWRPNLTGFTINSDTSLSLSVPNDRAIIKADLSMGSSYANAKVDVNMWQHNGTGHAWESFDADANGDINVSMSVKKGTDYRMEVFNPSTWEGFVVDLGTSVTVGGSGAEADSLITNQNSWATDGTWGPKNSTLIDASNDVTLGILIPPSLRTITFTVNNLDGNTSGNAPTEQIFIDLEALDADNLSIHEWYGMDNADWSNWQNPTFSNTISIKVPDNANGYRVMIHPMNHKGGALVIGTGAAADANETIPVNSDINVSTWEWDKADKITVSADQNYTITLPAAADMKSISGTVNLGSGDIESGWIHAWNSTNGNGTEVNADGTFEIKGLEAGTYTLEYWAWNETGDMLKEAGIDATNDVTGLTITKSAEVHTLAGQVAQSDDNTTAIANSVVLLLDIDSSDGTISTGDKWEVIGDKDVNETITYEFNVSAPLTNHFYLVAMGVKEVNTTTGATTFTIVNPMYDGNITNNSNTGYDTNATDINTDVDDIGTNSNYTIKVDHSKNY